MLWIRLTVAGVTRIGYGHAEGKKGPDAVKETIGDSIRNAAMRFGVALDLWGAKFKESGDVGVMLITHYTRILRHITPDFVHVFAGGRIVESGGAELAEHLENEGYVRYAGQQETAHIG